MSDWTPAQAKELEDPKRFAIYEFLKDCEKPQALGQIAKGIDLRDPARVHFHLTKLVDDDWVCTEDICSVLRNFGADISVRQAAPALRRMELETRPRVESVRATYNNFKEYRLTEYGRSTVSRRFPGPVVKEKRR